MQKKQIKNVIYLVYCIFINPQLISQNLLTNNSTNYLIDNGLYTIIVSKKTGMIESLILKNSEFELVSDKPAYSLFFPEYVYEADDGHWGWMHFPGENDFDVNTVIKLNTHETVIIDVSWITGYIDSYWTYVFSNNSPTFRASIVRKVARTGVYSNAQHCVMYSADMDESYIVNYEGNILLTMGDIIESDFPIVTWENDPATDASPWTSTHSLWTVFDYSTPSFFPTMIWRKKDENITVGVITIWTSPNQRSTISYHGGGASHSHPGFAEGQWNWFGKSDSESLYLLEGTTYDMELIFYQTYGHVDSLFYHFKDKLNPQIYRDRPIEDYSIASWGGRTSLLDRYFWRFPQISNNSITSQRLFRHHAFAVPRSQNGKRDNQLFSLYLFANDDEINLTPNYGHSPLFDSLFVYSDDSIWTGGMSWNVNGINTWLKFSTVQNSNDIHISGNIEINNAVNLKNIYLKLSLSPRVEEVKNITDDNILEIWSKDSILDTIGISVYNLDELSTTAILNNDIHLYLLELPNDTLLENGTNFSFSLDLNAHFGYTVDNQSEISSHTDTDQYFKSYFYRMDNAVNNFSFEPNSDYVWLDFVQFLSGFKATLWCRKALEELYIYINETTITDVRNVETNHKYLVENEGSNGIYRIIGNFKKGLNTLIFNLEEESLINQNIKYYPNPVYHNINFEFFSANKIKGEFIIIDIIGRQVCSIPISIKVGKQVISIPVSNYNLSSGVYFGKLVSGRNITVSKFLVLH